MCPRLTPAGLLNIASYSFLISITRREQVAQILGKPIYVIKDVSIFPLSSQADAEKAIGQAVETWEKDKNADTDVESSGDEDDGYESLDEREANNELPSDAKKLSQSKSQSSIAQDVIGRRGQYGRFAAQWFSRAGWSQERKRTLGMSTEDRTRSDESSQDTAEEARAQPGEVDPEAAAPPLDSTARTTTNAFELMPKLLKTTRTLFNSRSFFFSYDVNITRRLGLRNSLWSKPPIRDAADPLYFWNRQLVAPFSSAGYYTFYLPIMQGFIGQRAFIAKDDKKDNGQTTAVESLEKILKADGGLKDELAGQSSTTSKAPQPFLLTVISRRSVNRSGLRYLRRGIDDEGNTANSVETEQILSSPTWEESSPIRSFIQIRGSIPLYFSQSPYAFKPVPVLHQSQEANQAAFQRHFDDLRQKYGNIQAAVLVDKHGSEVKIGEEYEAYTSRYNEQHSDRPIAFEWFDFHAECRGMKFENVKLLIDNMEPTLKNQGETVLKDKTTVHKQSGIIRTNCMDCLDRTNVVQSAFGQYILEQDLRDQGFNIDFREDPTTQWFNSLWADNGDAISRQYAGTAALKGDFTRTRKRNYRGALNDFSLTLSRYYNNIVNDYFSQAVIDYLLGNVTMQAFEDFESDMMSTDPGVSIDRVREKAIDTCFKIVIHNEAEDLIHGWTMLSPNLPNTLRSLPFEESVLLLTDRAVYVCKFNWNTEKVDSFERVELSSVTNIRYGTYVTSTMTDRQLDENRNVGLVVAYNPGRGNIIRTNTRSLQNEVAPEKGDTPGGQAPGAKGLTRRGKNDDQVSRFLAFKAISPPSLSEKNGNNLMANVEQIAGEIQRAATNSRTVATEEIGVPVEELSIISASDARKRTSYLEQLGHQVKKLVWA